VRVEHENGVVLNGIRQQPESFFTAPECDLGGALRTGFNIFVEEHGGMLGANPD
jgi:hypothetical protein